MLFNFLIFLMWVWIVLILFVVGVFYLLDMVMGGVYCNFVVVVIFIFVVLIDWFDGFFVCKWNQMLLFGVFFDLVVDKLMVMVVLLIFVQILWVDVVIVLVIVGCEIVILVLCEWMVQIGVLKSVVVNQFGKFKIVCQMVVILMLLFYGLLLLGIVMIDMCVWGEWLMYLVVVLIIWLMLYYMKFVWLQICECGGV